MIEKIDRIAIAVKDLKTSAAFFSDLLGVTWDTGHGAPEVLGRLGLEASYSPSGLELVASTAEGSFIERFIERRGEGVYAVVLKVADMDAAVAHFEAKGLRKTVDFTSGEMREVAFDTEQTHGVGIVLAAYPDRHPATIAAGGFLAGKVDDLLGE
ncbi:MAG: VOC family protein [Myxococcota bacterium]